MAKGKRHSDCNHCCKDGIDELVRGPGGPLAAEIAAISAGSGSRAKT